jgi:MFS transporter, ACS family, glucarate transporter
MLGFDEAIQTEQRHCRVHFSDCKPRNTGATITLKSSALTIRNSRSNNADILRSRRRLLFFLWLISVVTYLDRVNIAIASPLIAREYGLTRVELGTIFSLFVLGYTVFQIPGGMLGDRFNPKNILSMALVWWSLFTAATAWAGKGVVASVGGVLVVFWIVRFLIGIGEAATFPCANGLIGEWFGDEERGVATGIMFAGVGTGSALAPPLIAWLMLQFGWRSAFCICGCIGMLVAYCFYRYIGDHPSRDRVIQNSGSTASASPRGRTVDDEPLAPQEATPWRSIIRNPQIWLLTMSDFCHGYVVYVYFSSFYIYLIDFRGLSLVRSSFFAALPFIAMTVSAPLGGWMSDRLILRVERVRARRLVAMGGLLAAVLFICFGATSRNAYFAIACLSLGAGSLYAALSSYWATALDIVPSHSATVSGVVNTGANLGGVLSPTLTPWIAARYGWVTALCVAAVLGLVAAVLWAYIGTPTVEISQHATKRRNRQ